MTFTKENAKTLGSKGGKANVKNRRDLFDLVASDHKDAYNEKLEKLQNGKQLTIPELDFMDRVEKLFPYKYPKLTSVNQTGEIKHEVHIVPEERVVEIADAIGEV